MQSLPCDRRTIHARQKHKTRCNLARLTGPANRRSKLFHRILRHCRRYQRRPYRSGSDGIDPDTLGAILIRQASCEGYYGAFGRSVIEKVRAADVGVDGSVIDDGVTALHMGNGILAEVEERMDVGVEGVHPLVPGKSLTSVHSTSTIHHAHSLR
jgi:hypothetical protein